MRRIAIVNSKGGVGKSVTATTLAVGLARRGRPTLLIDCDAQANASWTLGGGGQGGVEPPTLSQVLVRQATADEAIRATSVPKLDLLPADSTLSGVNVALAGELGRDTRLRSAMAPCAGRWDFVVLDTAPTFTTVLANALVFASEVVVPVDPSVYAVLGLVALQEVVGEIREAYGNDELHLAGLLLTKMPRTKVAAEVEAELRARFGGLVFKATIPQSARVEEAVTAGSNVIDHAGKSPAGQAYQRFIDEVLSHGGCEETHRGPTQRRPRKGDAA